jgi:hypothetical protein
VESVVSVASLSTQTGLASVFGGTTIPASTAAALVTTVTTTEITKLVASATSASGGSATKSKNAAATSYEFNLGSIRGLVLVLGAAFQYGL